MFFFLRENTDYIQDNIPLRPHFSSTHVNAFSFSAQASNKASDTVAAETKNGEDVDEWTLVDPACCCCTLYYVIKLLL